MKSMLQALGIVMVVFLLSQTHESARLRGVTVTCTATEAERSDCPSLGALGGVNSSGVAFWVTSFVDHSLALPRALVTKVRNQAKGGHF